MSKYRILKVPMFNLVGSTSFYGYHYGYEIQKRSWYGVWWRVGEYSVTLEGAKKDLERLVAGHCTKDGSEVVYEQGVE